MTNDRVLVELVRTFGVLQVMVKRPCPRGEKRYLVVNRVSGRILEEFRYRSSAETWALRNREG